ncbi:60s ribosomal protein L36, putative [Cryptosporidium muris RN66]|uniref:60S ribosomal protein L36 n=1 Tax=Cryptosporidium muris (strain RN66) TaxID=441375 RepID=B6AGX5_CRYMR|nr:60s ribosomal protein L36, putative [Cryptosporidium muris RN66]EEA07466.1 60s ribosomal protein L36, putative [Cryptosporidium muris RN66]|eukprot:XP_002141815.1 60s ribosomal protein L36 [Cryptosporidium muris RN66]
MTRSVLSTGISVGSNRGYIVTKRAQKPRPSSRKGKLCARNVLVRQVIREVAGFAPYEKRMMELLKVGSASTAKRAMKFARSRLGTEKRAKKKRDELVEIIQQQRKRTAA